MNILSTFQKMNMLLLVFGLAVGICAGQDIFDQDALQDAIFLPKKVTPNPFQKAFQEVVNDASSDFSNIVTGETFEIGNVLKTRYQKVTANFPGALYAGYEIYGDYHLITVCFYSNSERGNSQEIFNQLQTNLKAAKIVFSDQNWVIITDDAYDFEMKSSTPELPQIHAEYYALGGYNISLVFRIFRD